MRAKLKSKITGATKSAGLTSISLIAEGKADTTNINAQEASFSGTLHLKSLIADKLTLGSIITITLSDEEVE